MQIDSQYLKQFIQRYQDVSFKVNKKLSVLTRDLIEDDLTSDQLSILHYILKSGRITSTELADAFYVGKSSITAIINRLVDKKYIQRIPDSTDRRVMYLVLTEEGLLLAQQSLIKVEEMLASYLGHFELSEVEQFIQVYEKFARLISE